MSATLDQDFPPMPAGPGWASANNGLAKLREPFPAHQVSTFPKNAGQKAGLSYVGHAALTDRLLDVDPLWSWEPMSVDARGLPVLDDDGGMWIRLTVCGVTRLGYGDAQGKTGGNAMKERIGDALRNSAMRFGAALDLWHKGELHIESEVTPPPKPELPTYADEAIESNLAAWAGVVESGRKTADSLIATLKTKAVLSADQEERIRAGLESQQETIIDAEFVESYSEGEAA